MRRPLIVLLALLFMLATSWSYGHSASPEKTFSVRGGYLLPDLDEWDEVYGADGEWTGGVELGWKLTRQIELAINLNYFSTEGNAKTVSGRATTDKIDYSQAWSHASLLYRAVFNEDQMLVPYLGGGLTYLFYWEELDGNEFTGDMYGYHFRGGLQLLLDRFDEAGARSFFRSWHVYNTYFFLDAVLSTIDDFGSSDVDLGGIELMGGIMVEF